MSRTLVPEPHTGQAGQNVEQYSERTSAGVRKPAHLIPPKPDFNSERVFKFNSASGEGLLNTTVIDNAGRSVYRFEKTGPQSFVMLTADGTEYANLDDGKVNYPGSKGVKAKKFMLKNSGRTGNT